MTRAAVVLALLLAAQTHGAPAWAQEPDATPSGDGEKAGGEPPAKDSAGEEPDRHSTPARELLSYWAEGEPRTFMAASVDVGYLYFRPRASFGYGKPHFYWLGVDANPIVNGSAAGGYGGIRAAHPNVNLRAGGRFFTAFRRSFLRPRENDKYDRKRVDFRGDKTDPTVAYWAWEAELTLDFDLGPGTVNTESAVTYLSGVPKDRLVFEEQLRVVAVPPWILRQRIAYLGPGLQGAVGFGPVGEVVVIPERDYATTYRAGLLVRQKLFETLQVRANFIFSVYSPDKLGLRGADFGVGLRWLWATGLED